jgi:hypothetical protein
MRTLLISLILFLGSCTTLNKNLVKEGSYDISGGVYKNMKWDDSLTFKRVSWFKELTLTFDVFYTPVPKESPFYSWFSEDEKKLMSKCVDSLVALTYAWDPMQISRNDFYTRAEELGYERLSIPHFHSQVKMHPNFARINVYLYKTSLLCRKNLGAEKLVISFPGFSSVTL